jgi:hypothetical protein
MILAHESDESIVDHTLHVGNRAVNACLVLLDSDFQ